MEELQGTELVISVSGNIKANNFDDFKAKVLGKIDGINLAPVTDEELAEAKETVRELSTAEKILDKARGKALDETADIRDLFSSMTEIADKLRNTRLALNKKVKKAENKRKNKILQDGVKEVQAHIESLHKANVFMPVGMFHVCTGDFVLATKGKKKLETYQKAVDDKIVDIISEFNAKVSHCEINFKKISAVKPSGLFPDIEKLISEPLAVVDAKIEARIAKHNFEQKTAEPVTVGWAGNNKQVTKPKNPIKRAHDPIKRTHNPIVDNTYYLLTIKLGGDVATVKAIAMEVDSVVSKHRQVLSISLTPA